MSQHRVSLSVTQSKVIRKSISFRKIKWVNVQHFMSASWHVGQTIRMPLHTPSIEKYVIWTQDYYFTKAKSYFQIFYKRGMLHMHD